jgi:hypothetical protein
MAVNLIVVGVTLLMAGFLGVWLCFPRLRVWMEQPKYRFLEEQRRFPEVRRDRCPEEANMVRGCSTSSDPVYVSRNPRET